MTLTTRQRSNQKKMNHYVTNTYTRFSALYSVLIGNVMLISQLNAMDGRISRGFTRVRLSTTSLI